MLFSLSCQYSDISHQSSCASIATGWENDISSCNSPHWMVYDLNLHQHALQLSGIGHAISGMRSSMATPMPMARPNGSERRKRTSAPSVTCIHIRSESAAMCKESSVAIIEKLERKNAKVLRSSPELCHHPDCKPPLPLVANSMSTLNNDTLRSATIIRLLRVLQKL